MKPLCIFKVHLRIPFYFTHYVIYTLSEQFKFKYPLFHLFGHKKNEKKFTITFCLHLKLPNNNPKILVIAFFFWSGVFALNAISCYLWGYVVERKILRHRFNLNVKICTFAEILMSIPRYSLRVLSCSFNLLTLIASTFIRFLIPRHVSSVPIKIFRCTTAMNQMLSYRRIFLL